MILVGGEGDDILVILLLPLSRLQFEGVVKQRTPIGLWVQYWKFRLSCDKNSACRVYFKGVVSAGTRFQLTNFATRSVISRWTRTTVTCRSSWILTVASVTQTHLWCMWTRASTRFKHCFCSCSCLLSTCPTLMSTGTPSWPGAYLTCSRTARRKGAWNERWLCSHWYCRSWPWFWSWSRYN